MATWTILIATLGRRGDRFARLMGGLLPQLDQAGGEVTVEALWNNGERPLCEVRQDLMEHTASAYTSFVDDDDVLPPYYVERVLPLLDGVDYIGWRMQCILNGAELAPTYHSLEYTGWYSDNNGHYRDISHLNPVRRELAMAHARFRPPVQGAEDSDWSSQLRGHLKTQHMIGECMYYYHASDADTTWAGAGSVPPPGTYTRPEFDSPYFSWHPASSR